MDQDDTPLPPRRWPGAWFRDYTFWRDVTSTVIGGMLVLVVAFLWAIFMGYVTNPGLWQAIGSFFAAVSIPGLLMALIPVGGLLLSWCSHKLGWSTEDRFGAEIEASYRSNRSRPRPDEGTHDGEV